MSDVGFTPQHAARLDQAHNRLDGLDQRVMRLETSEAVIAERMKHIQGSLDSINSNISKVVWLIIAGLVSAAIAFIIRGGLTLGQ